MQQLCFETTNYNCNQTEAFVCLKVFLKRAYEASVMITFTIKNSAFEGQASHEFTVHSLNSHLQQEVTGINTFPINKKKIKSTNLKKTK